ncbi:glutaminase A [Glycomyces tarimensis]
MDVGTEVITNALESVRATFEPRDGGAVADYIPQLALAEPERFGIALASVDGRRYAAGDVDAGFTLQSVSKPFVYALVLAEHGLDEVSRWVGTEPSGEAFNSIRLEPDTGRPANPMINAGAIVTTALMSGSDLADRFERILVGLSRFAGRSLDVDESVYASESLTGDRNRALAYLMRSAGSLPGEVHAAVDTYFRQCSVRATAADVALMAATLANDGVNPATGTPVVPAEVATQVLSVMATCGMYNSSGEWLVRVGLPAKSGVSGIVMAASPARFGVAAYSPRIDPAGNSVRGVAALRTLADRFGLHLMRHAETAGPSIEDHSGRIGIVAAQGVLDFGVAERLLNSMDEAVGPARARLVFDLSAVVRTEPVAVRLVATALERLAARGHRVAVVGGALDRVLDGAEPVGWHRFDSRDEAVVWAESDGAA